MYFIRLVCLLFAFVPPKDTKFLTYFFNVRPLTSHSNVFFFFFKCIIILPSYNVLCYASATDVTTVLLYKCMTLAGEKTEHCKRKKTKNLMWDLSFSPFVSLIFFQLCAYQIKHWGNGEFWEITLYLWCYHFVEK